MLQTDHKYKDIKKKKSVETNTNNNICSHSYQIVRILSIKSSAACNYVHVHYDHFTLFFYQQRIK